MSAMSAVSAVSMGGMYRYVGSIRVILYDLGMSTMSTVSAVFVRGGSAYLRWYGR